MEYWDLNIEKNFQGSEKLFGHYKYILEHLATMYREGHSVCFAGNHGIGKTFVSTSLLKRAAQKNYSCLYTTLSDMVAVLTNAPDQSKFEARQKLLEVDFLVVDELDPRYIHTQFQADFFGALLENIFRTRTQNKLPTIFCTNSPNPIEAFSGNIKKSIESLFSRVKTLAILGPDFRQQQKPQ